MVTTPNTDIDFLNNIYNMCMIPKIEVYLHSSFDSEEESGVEFRSAIVLKRT